MPRPSVRVTDAQWAKIEPHLPRPRRSPQGGRPRVSNRDVVDGILWVLKTGARWRDLPDGYPSGSTCWRRLRQWDEDGTWLRMWRAFLGQLDARGRLRWEHVVIDGSFASAKQGARTSAKPVAARGRSGWWWSTAKVFLWEYMSPRPAWRRSRSSRPTLNTIRVPRRGGGRPRQNPDRLIGDRGSDSDPLRERLARRGVTAIVPYRSWNLHRHHDDGRHMRRVRHRWIIERTFAWLGSFRRLLIRHERLTSVYCSLLYFAAALITLRRF